MIESSLGITAAAHLSPLVDYADLDGNLLIKNDPFSGVTLNNVNYLITRNWCRYSKVNLMRHFTPYNDDEEHPA